MTFIGVKLVCGWGCPVGTLQELLYHLPASKKIKKERVPFRISNSLRVFLFVLFMIFLFGWIAVSEISQRSVCVPLR
jgi:polyferredoxin